MKKSKINKEIRLLSIMLSLVMAFSIMPVTVREASASDSEVTASGTCGDNLTWVFTDDGTLTISGTGDMTDFSSSSSVSWYSYREEIVKVVIGSGVTSIGDYAFAYCRNMEEAEFADTLKSIGYRSFFCCYALLNAELPAAIESIGISAFSSCNSMQSILLSENLTDIGEYAFYNCEVLNSVEIPENVTSIGQRAFYGCSALTEVIFAGDAPQIGTDVWECVKYFRYHSSKSGWEDAIVSWSVPDGAVWYDLDSMLSASDFSITSELSLSVGESQTITTNADDYISSTFSWSSSDSSVAYVSRDGTVTGLNAGAAVVTVQTEDSIYKAQCTVTVTETSSSLPTVNTVISDSTVSNNISDNNYRVWSSTVNSYLYENEDGTLTRVEYISGTGVVIETIDQSTGQASSVTTLDMELSIWGGFYSGEEYNFLVFGQTNYDEDDSVEVIRVVKYSKNWERLDACSIYGHNTYYPFAYGSLKMTETGGNLYIRSCHQMYVSSDGLNHQANMTFVIDEEEMTVVASSYRIASSVFGYVSHSFNQFIQTDGEYIYCADHGDAYPRAINLSKASADRSSGDELEVYSILGETGENATGVSIGGFELSTENCLIVGNSVDMSDEDTYDTSGQRNIFLIVADKDLAEANTIWLTDYTEDDGITPRTPQLVSVASDIFLIMWEEVDSDGSITTKLVLVDADGNLLSDITELCIRLSDCQPVVTEDGIVTWYVTNGYRTTLYQINPFRLSESKELAHSYDDGTVTEAADCTTDGVLTYTCSVCGETKTETIPATGHDYDYDNVSWTWAADYSSATAAVTCKNDPDHVIEVSADVSSVTTAAVCETAGQIVYTAEAVFSGSGTYTDTETVVLAALGHSWDDGVVTTEPTCTEAGVLTYTCENDSSHTYTETIAATGHSWTSVTVSAGSCGSTKTTYTCSACGKEKTVTSLYGSDRYKTASDIVANTFESCTYAVIADGSNFPDALAAASLAGAVDAPILITSDSKIQNTIEELKSLGVTNVYIVGGTSSVSAGAQSAIEAEGIEVERIAGSTRQLTAAAVAEEVLSITGGQDVCLVATGKTYADALAASPYAYWSSSPIYLTNNNGSISAAVLASIEAAGYSQIIIIGGTSSVTEETEEALSEIASVTRLGGDTRYETAAIIAEWSVEQGMSYDGLTVATGTNYPDALTASALCGKNGSVLLLSAASVSSSSVLEEVITENADDISDIYIVGGNSSVSEEIREMITDALK